jgi:hypothetical protein
VLLVGIVALVLDDQSRFGRFAGMTGSLLASCNKRESVCWRRPVSTASCRALTASLPVKRVTIFCLNARENGFVTESLPSRPAVQPRNRATTILTLGAEHIGNTFGSNDCRSVRAGTSRRRVAQIVPQEGHEPDALADVRHANVRSANND